MRYDSLLTSLIVTSPRNHIRTSGADCNVIAPDTQGYQDVRGLSATDPHLRHWISVCTMPEDVFMLL